MAGVSVTYRLDRAQRPRPTPPVLDASQQAVVAHEGGPLLVLAGPGTGKTTTLVEAVVDRIERRGAKPDQVLVLTFSRKAADELRTRILSRLGRTSSALPGATFHSFCYGLVRRHQPAELYATPMRLLSAPEQDVRLRELLRHSRDGGRVHWPTDLDQALRTRGFAREVRAVLARAREVGLEPADLVGVGRQSGKPEWVAAGAFLEQYLDVLGFEGAVDYSELVHRAVLLAESEEVRAELRASYDAVFVDEYQDTDPSQVRLLQALAGDGRDLVVVGDPDQSIYGFRGADVRGILEFPTRFPKADGTPADVVSLSTTRRFGARLLGASRRVAAGIGFEGSIPAEALRRFRNPEAADGPFGPGRLDVLEFSSGGAQSAHIADILRRAHLEDEVPWSEMAVLVRSGTASIPSLRRALVSASVPVEVAGDELPLRSEPAVQPLLLALRAAVDLSEMSAETARTLLLSPMVELDAGQVRVLGRLLRQRDRADHLGVRLPLGSDELLRQTLADPSMLRDVQHPLAARPRAFADLLHRAHRHLAAGGSAEEALWILWSGTRWPRRLRGAVERGGAGARSANRDLDAICALFETAARAEERQDHTGALVFLEEIEAQQIPGDTLVDRGVRGDAVRLLTAHRSKGLEWRLVVVAGVQEGSWPDLRRRGSLLQADRLGPDGLTEPLSSKALLAEERRLFYVATTRARQRLVVTAVRSPEADGEQPSRLIDALDLPVESRPGRPGRSMSLPGLVAELRRITADATVSEPLRLAAAARLAGLAAERIGDEPLVAGADPDEWWGLRERTTNDTPVRPMDQPLRISASALTSILDCPLRWFLAREAAGETSRSTSLGFGSIVHALTDHMGKHPEVSREDLTELVDSVWSQLPFDSPWIARRERAAVEDVISRFVDWHGAARGRRYVGSEIPFRVDVRLGNGDTVTLTGQVDRLETDRDGQTVVVDFKTSKTAPTDKSIADNPQLGLYQLAAQHGAFADLVGESARSGGAELVQLRIDAAGLPKVQHQPPQPVDASGRRPVEVQLAQSAETIRNEAFDATANGLCSFCDFVAMCPAQQSGTVLS
jgi:superfamily I DNA/RNA helicase/RecB family exonuclease